MTRRIQFGAFLWDLLVGDAGGAFAKNLLQGQTSASSSAVGRRRDTTPTREPSRAT